LFDCHQSFNLLGLIEGPVNNCHSFVRIKTIQSSSENKSSLNQKTTDISANTIHALTTEQTSATIPTSTEVMSTSTSTMMDITTTSQSILSSPLSSPTPPTIQTSSSSTTETIQTTPLAEQTPITALTEPSAVSTITNAVINETEIKTSNQTKDPSSVTLTHIEETFKSIIESKK
jgi:hypothetical protein